MKRPLGTLLALCLGMFACSDETSTPGELILAFQTDMRLPQDTDKVRILITRFGKTEFDSSYDVGTTGTAKIPATLGVVAGSNPSDPIKVSVTAISKGVPQVLREATTTIPQNRIATLRMPLQWLCYGPRSVSGATAENQVSACPEDQTCVAGSCQSQLLDSSLLPDFDSASIFGGGKGDGDGKCFETETLLPATLQSIEPSVVNGRCTVPKPNGDGEKLNVGIKLLEGASTCADGGCVVPLDRDPEGGWSLEGDKILLPMMACTLHSAGKLDVIASVGAPSKTLSLPMCGPWSATSTLSAPGVTPQDAAELIPASGSDGGLPASEPFVTEISSTVEAISVITTGAGPNVFYRTSEGIFLVEIATGKPVLVPLSQSATRLVSTPTRLVYQTVDTSGVFAFLYSVAIAAPTTNEKAFYGPQSDLQFVSAADDGNETQAFWFLSNTLQGCSVSNCLGSMGSLTSVSGGGSPLDLAASAGRLAWAQGSPESGVVRLCPRPKGDLTSAMCETDQEDTPIGQYVPGSMMLTGTHLFFRTSPEGLQWCSVNACKNTLVTLTEFPDHTAPISSGVFTAKGANITFYDLTKNSTAIVTAPANVTALYADESYYYYATSSDARGYELWKAEHKKGNP